MPKIPFWVFIIIAILYFTATRVDIMDIDASQYSEISREMLKSGDFLHVFDRGMDYLDKPPFLFWVNVLSMKVFGVGNFGYKFPSVVFALLGIIATFKLTKRLYGTNTAWAAALILAASQGMMLWTNDVRCDTILMSCVISAVWLIKEWEVTGRLRYLVWGSVAIGAGMLAKGPIAIMVPVFALGADWALKRQWRNFVRPQYLLSLLVIGLLLLPMSIGLYQQFDMHPEKVVNGVQGPSGLRFYFWSQSFGRITGENPWKNDVNIGFQLQNMLWSYLPWIFLFLPAVVISVYQLIRQKFRLREYQEGISVGGFLLAYLALGSSSYQLPHYIFVAFPFAAIMNAKLFYDMLEAGQYQKMRRVMNAVQTVVILLMVAVMLLLITYVFPAGPLVIAAAIACIGIWLFLIYRKPLQGRMVLLSASGMIVVNIFLTNHVYRTLLQYQVGSQVGRYIHDRRLPADAIGTYEINDPLNALDFRAQEIIRRVLPGGIAGKSYLLTTSKGLDSLTRLGYAYDTLKQGVFFKVSELTPEFLNPATRSQALSNYYFVKLRH